MQIEADVRFVPDGADAALNRLVGALDLVEVPAIGGEAHDVDTWEDVRELRRATEEP